MGRIYHALGLSVALIQHEHPEYSGSQPAFIYDPDYGTDSHSLQYLRPVPRHQAYVADITYGTNNEFGFDYLRDNMVVDLSQRVQRDLNYAIVDEVDNILIDEARTPLIIPRLRKSEDYEIEERTRAVTLTESGIAKIERSFGLPNLYDPENEHLIHYVDNALRAHVLYQRDKDYVVQNGEVIIVDDFTGRLMHGRRYSEGLHQAIEAKEHVKIQQESRTMATITFQNYFRMYNKLAGMTGTAVTEAEEFHKIYKLDCVVMPTNKPMVREDYKDHIYKNENAKYRAVVSEIESLHKEGCPVLVGTVSIENSELLAEMLEKRGIKPNVLNAKQHEKEAAIVSQAGRCGAITIATNMAGRGVDIILGGNPDARDKDDWQAEHDKVVQLGGLRVIGTERHEARRIDNQLSGRAGRQGDPGTSRFYVSFEDDLMRRFGGDRVKSFMERVGFDEDTPLEYGLVSRVIENAQTKVEAYHFDIRKHLVEYDDVVNRHREIIYAERNKLLSGADIKSNIQDMVSTALKTIVYDNLHDDHGDDWDIDGLINSVKAIYPLPPQLNSHTLSQMSRKEVEQQILEAANDLYEQKEQDMGPENMRVLERLVILRLTDSRWVDHLTSMENMRQGIGLESLRQRDPLVEYKRQGHTMFQDLMDGLQGDIVHTIYRVSMVKESKPKERERAPVSVKAGRNDPCPCGSGKKYKKCCGR